jgi:hypothetical protein
MNMSEVMKQIGYAFVGSFSTSFSVCREKRRDVRRTVWRSSTVQVHSAVHTRVFNIVSQRASYPENCIEVVTVCEEETGLVGAILSCLGTPKVGGDGDWGSTLRTDRSFLISGITELDATAAFTIASGCVNAGVTAEATSGVDEVAAGTGADAGAKLEEFVLWEFKAFIAFFNSLWNTFFIRSVAYINSQAEMITYKHIIPTRVRFRRTKFRILACKTVGNLPLQNTLLLSKHKWTSAS